jgi:signal transduction histidine kinase/ActR/RegA family two-component response regulator
MSSDEAKHESQLHEITESIISMAALDFSSPPQIHGSGPLDAVAAGLIALNEELKATVVARSEAESANETKSQFLANMSHELRTPLTSLMGGMELLAHSDLNDSQRHILTQMKWAGIRLLRLISDVLDFSKIEAGHLQFEHKPLRLRDSIATVIAQHLKQAKTKGLSLQSNHADLPDISVLGDAQRIEQVLNNLVDNALKYTTQGKVCVETQLQIEDSRVAVVIRVTDTGPGIAHDLQNRLFERFTSGDSSVRRRTSGAGLGLSIARSLTESMKGQLTLKSEPPKGACFTLSLPFELAHQNAAWASPTECTPALHHHVLLVDDTPMVRTVTARMLEFLGCTVATAASGLEAIQIVGKEDFELILMDCQMPGMDGLETAERLLRLHPHRHLRIAAITAHAGPEDAVKVINSGMLGQLNKPFTLNEIEAFILQMDRDHPHRQS